MKANIILIGFMAAGKSRIGQLLARKLDYKLIDLDLLVQERAGKSIQDIFSQHGEAYFRDLELAALKTLEKARSLVIVTGGGTPLFFSAAQELKKLGRIYFLDASFELVSKRLEKSNKRPLAHVDLYERYYFRRPLYEFLGERIDVNHQEQERSAQEIIDNFLERQNLEEKLAVIKVPDPFKPYEIFLGHDAINYLDSVLNYINLNKYKLVVVTSERLKDILLNNIITKNILVIYVKDGESCKNWASVEHIHNKLFEHNCTRHTVIIALGGGTVGDVAGFAASLYMRGLPVIQVPTSLLAMVDSSVGGKTGIDISLGKNLLGSFHMPKAVLINTSFLKTLAPREYACGMAEIIKHAVIGDNSLFDDLLHKTLEPQELIRRALDVKINLVARDPDETNVRAHLNLGHTYAHAIEKVSDYRIKHGEAVAMGLVQASMLGARLGVLEEDFLPELLKLLKRYDLPISMPDLDN